MFHSCITYLFLYHKLFKKAFYVSNWRFPNNLNNSVSSSPLCNVLCSPHLRNIELENPSGIIILRDRDLCYLHTRSLHTGLPCSN